MFGYTLGVASQGLEILRKSIDIRSRNILNASNLDYAEEEAVIKSLAPVGITLESIQRFQNFHYVSLRNDKTSTVNSLEERIRINNIVEDLFQEFLEGTGGSEFINRAFTSYQNLMKDPTNVGARSNLLANAQSLVNYLKDRKKDMDRIDQAIDSSMRDHIKSINDLTSKISKINNNILISYVQTYSKGRDYKNLLDERDKYLRELSQYVNIRAQEDEIGRVRVETGGGFVLVEDRHNWELSYDASNQSIEWNSKDGSKVNISSLITDGKVRGLLNAKEDIKRYLSKLENVAKGIISKVSLPVINGIAYISSGFDSYNNQLGLSGQITLNGSSSFTITINASDSLRDIAKKINDADVGFRANVVVNEDGTYSIEVISQNTSYTIQGAVLNIQPTDRARVFVGYDIHSMSVNPSLENVILKNLDYPRAYEFNDLSRGWWEAIKSSYTDLASDVATVLHDAKNKKDIEGRLLIAIESKLQEIQGVSLDKEFLEVMKLQRSYQALAKAIAVVDELLQTTLNII